MKLEHESSEKLKKLITHIIGKHINLSEYRVFFFGSRVSGKSDEWSDIDIGIEGKKPLPLGVLGAIRDEFEEVPVLFKIDVVDLVNANQHFKDLAKEHVEYII